MGSRLYFITPDDQVLPGARLATTHPQQSARQALADHLLLQRAPGPRLTEGTQVAAHTLLGQTRCQFCHPAAERPQDQEEGEQQAPVRRCGLQEKADPYSQLYVQV